MTLNITREFKNNNTGDKIYREKSRWKRCNNGDSRAISLSGETGMWLLIGATLPATVIPTVPGDIVEVPNLYTGEMTQQTKQVRLHDDIFSYSLKPDFYLVT